jgi:hypothetical protein
LRTKTTGELALHHIVGLRLKVTGTEKQELGSSSPDSSATATSATTFASRPMETGGETISILLDYLQRSFSAFRHGLSSITSQQCSGSSLAELQAALKGDPTMDDNTAKKTRVQ